MRFFKQITSILFKKEFIILLSGVFLSQIINVLFAPLLSRFYSPLAFGIFTNFQSWSSIIGTLIFLRMEYSVMTWQNRSNYLPLINFLVFVGLVNVVFSALILFFVFGFSGLFYLALMNVFFIGFNNLMYYISLKENDQKSCALSRIMRFLMFNVLTLVFSYLISCAYYWLIIGQSASLIIEFIILLKGRMYVFSSFKVMSKRSIRFFFKKNINYVRWNLPHVFVDLLNDFGYMLLLGMLFGKEVLGFYSMMYRVIKLPTSIIGSALYQYSFSIVSNKGNLSARRVVFNNYITSFFIGFPIFFIFLVFGREIIVFVFGESWYNTGKMIQFFSIAYLLNFIATSSSFITLVANRMNIGFYITLIDWLFRMLSLFIGYYMNSWEVSFMILSVLMSIVYISGLYLYYKLAIDVDLEKNSTIR